ncbi:ketoreductase domain-containing protein, partial [Salmonella enterica subsp. enterica serovar Typhimurium]|nr:ketoreductase domain-containing protein [Salmonella enterica subsp. enterica serovar Typhimurium]
WQAVLAPKIAAARLLDEATRDDPLEAFVLFSSLAGAHGNVGQSVYAYANAWLDDYAEMRGQAVAEGRRRGRTLALAWPLW